MNLRFVPGPFRAWHRSADGAVWATGWAEVEGKILEGADLAEAARGGSDLAAWRGEWAFAAVHGGFVRLAVDHVRSVPLVFRVRGDEVLASDDFGAVAVPTDAWDRASLVEYASGGFVSGTYTLRRGVRSLRAGEVLEIGAEGARSGRHTTYAPAPGARAGDLAERFTRTLDVVFRRVARSVRGRAVVVPLSGGLDSRVVAASLVRAGVDDLRCVSYGLPGNTESETSRRVARELGLPWTMVPYSASMWKRLLRAPETAAWRVAAGNGTAFPTVGEYAATLALRRAGDLPEGSVFVPGHTGDFLSGGHLKYVFSPRLNPDGAGLVDAIARKHYALWADLAEEPYVRAVVADRVREVLGDWDDTPEGRAAAYERWEWQERQPKVIVNLVRAYEVGGFGYRVPLWDPDLMAFWASVPLEQKIGKAFYRTYLAETDPCGVFGDVAPGPDWTPEAVVAEDRADLARRASKLGAPGRRVSRTVSHWRLWRHHPLGVARAYGMMRYVLRDPTKRHYESLALREQLRTEFGIEIHDVGREAA